MTPPGGSAWEPRWRSWFWLARGPFSGGNFFDEGLCEQLGEQLLPGGTAGADVWRQRQNQVIGAVCCRAEDGPLHDRKQCGGGH